MTFYQQTIVIGYDDSIVYPRKDFTVEQLKVLKEKAVIGDEHYVY